MRKGLVAVVPLLAVLILAPVATAEDIWDPPWEIPDPTGTEADWDFTTNENPAYPEHVLNPYGEPFIELLLCDDYGVDPGLDGEYSTWHAGPPSGILHIQIHNDPNKGIRKEVFIQVTATNPPGVSSPNPGATVGPGPYPQIQHPGTGYYTYNYFMTIPGNPAIDYVTLDFPFCTYIEEIVIDTRCVPIPEPGLIAVFGLPALLLLRKRK